MKSYWTGIVLIVVGAIFLLDTLGIMRVGDLFNDYWPLVLIVIGVNILLNSIRSKETTTQKTNDQTD